MKRFWISNGVTLLVMGIGAVIQFLLAKEVEDQRNNRLDDLRTGVAGETEGSILDTARLQALSVLAGLAVTVINLVVAIVVNVFSFYERHPTRSGREKWLVVKLSVFYLVNSFVVPILASGTGEDDVQNWYTRGGLIEQAFYIQLTNAIIPDLLTLFNPLETLNFYIFSRLARTQNMLEKLMKPEPFYLAQRYAANVKTLGLAVFYMPALPLSPFIALLGLTLSYITDKIIALRRAQRPNQLNGQVIDLINQLLRLLPLGQMILMFRLYFDGSDAAEPVFWVGFAAWLVFSLFPISAILKWDVASKFGDWGTKNATFVDTIGRYAHPTQSKEATDRMKAYLPEVLEGDQNLALGEVYEPECPATCGARFGDKVSYHFNLPSEPYPPNPKTMPGQKKRTGGEALLSRPAKKSSGSLVTLSPVSADLAEAAKEVSAEMEAGQLGKQGSGGMMTHRRLRIDQETHSLQPNFTSIPRGSEMRQGTEQSSSIPAGPPTDTFIVLHPYAATGATATRDLQPGVADGPHAGVSRTQLFPVVIHRHQI